MTMRFLYVTLTCVVLASCQSAERSYHVGGTGVQRPAPGLCGQGEFILTAAGKIRCSENSN